MFTDKNILIDENDDNDFSSRNYNNNTSSRPLNQQTNNPMLARNLMSSDAKKPINLNFMKGGSNSNYDNLSNSPDYDNTKTSYLNKIKTLNSMNSGAQNPSNLFRPVTSVYQKKEEPLQDNEDNSKTGFDNKASFSNNNNENPGLRKTESVQIGMRPQSSQSQSNLVRQQFLEQQKQKLKEKQNSLIKNNTVTINNKSSTFNNPAFFDDKKKSEEIDYESLQKVVKQDDREQHEPGTNRKTFNLPGLNKVDHMISFKMQTQQPAHEKLVEYNLEDAQTSTRKEDASFLVKPMDKKTVVMKEIIKEEPRDEPDMLDDSAQQQRSSLLKEPSPLRQKGKAVKFNEENEEEEDLDAETIKIAKQIKALKEGKQQGEIKISLKGDGMTTFENKTTKKETKNEYSKKKHSEEQENEQENEEKRESEEEVVHAEEEEKIDPQSKNKNTCAKIFHNFDTIQDLREFLINPAPKNYIIQCVIRRERTGWGRIYPKYKVFFSNRGTFLLAGKKRSQNRTSNYLISLNADDFKKNSPNVMGKVRSNFLGTEFHVYDTGSNPKKALSFESVRKELAVVTYETNFFGAKGPRKMKALVPDVKEDGESFFQWKPTKTDDGMLNYFKSGKREGIRHLFNKPPKWNEHIGAFVLNFNGRVDKPSVKNFQLIDEYDDNIIYLQFGRTGNEEFTMDYMWPLTAVQAFGICLSSFDYKIACE